MKRIFMLCLVFILTFSFSACSSFSSKESKHVSNIPNKAKEAVSEVPKKETFKFNPYYLPEYGKEFIGDNLKDYNAIISALLKGETKVILTTVHTKEEFEQLIEQIFKDNVTEINNKVETAKELYLYVVRNTKYELNMTLETYDAFHLHRAYCQTYSKMYQYLLWQADIKNYLTSSLTVQHEWNMVCLDGEFYNMDTTWDTGNLNFFGMNDEKCAKTGHGTKYLRPSDALLDHYKGKTPVCTSDKYNSFE